MELEADTLVNDRLRLLRPLGEGGMGAVWVAEQLTLGCEVAVKFMTPERADDADMRARFLREPRAAARIASPHVVHVLDAATTSDGTPFIVMELCRGETLAERVERVGPLPPRDLAVIVEQLCQALGAAHAAGVIHRDIKLANVMVEDVGGRPFVRVLDFGIAKLQHGDEASLTKTRSLLGSPAFMSPEQVLFARDPAPAFDLWAVAVVAYVAITARYPFEGTTTIEVAQAVCDGRFTPPSALGVPGLDAFFARAFERDPSARFQTAEELAGALTGALAGLSVAAVVDAAPGALAPELAATVAASDPPPALDAADGLARAPTLIATRVDPISREPRVAPSATSLSPRVARPPLAAPSVWRFRMALAAALAAAALAGGAVGVWCGAAPGEASSVAAPSSSVAAPSSVAEPVVVAVPAPPSARSPTSAAEASSTCRSCADDGRCTPGPDGCIAAREADCEASAQCRSHGLCAPVEGRCRAATAAHCGAAALCAESGRCVLDGGMCCASECPACSRYGLCTYGPHGCTVTNVDCRASALCVEQGHCSDLRAMGCRPRDDADCAASRACLEHGRCHEYRSFCVRDPAAACPACEAVGACVPVAGACLATRAEHCRSALVCAEFGACTVGRTGGCEVGGDDDCSAAAVCKAHGWCRADARSCVAPGAEPCPQCAENGDCTRQVQGGCVATTKAHCQASRACRDEGRCSLGVRHCQALDAADCRESKACRVEGRCTVGVGGDCVR